MGAMPVFRWRCSTCRHGLRCLGHFLSSWSAVAQRPEVGLARQAVAAGQDDWQAARGGFLPRVFVRASAGRTDGQNVISGWQEGAGLHLETPLYAGGQHRGELRSAAADIQAAIADGQIILDAISLQVNLAYRGVLAANEYASTSRGSQLPRPGKTCAWFGSATVMATPPRPTSWTARPP